MRGKKGGVRKVFSENWQLTLLALIPFAYLIFYCYIPMGGLILAFKDYKTTVGIWGSDWVGLKFFKEFFNSIYAWRTISNTFILGFLTLLFSFPVPIIFALCINEIKNQKFKRFAQTASYLPYFMSITVVATMLFNIFSMNNGLVNHVLGLFDLSPIPFMNSSRWFRPLYIGSEVWQKFGYNSIIYIAAITSINPELYEVAEVDGCNRLKKMWHITLPGIKPTMVIMLILSFGSIFSVGFEKVMLLYTPGTYDVADVLQTYVYRKGIIDGNISFATAVGMLQSGVNFIMLLSVNTIARRLGDVSLW